MKDYLSAKWNLILLTKIAIYWRESSPLQSSSVVLLKYLLLTSTYAKILLVSSTLNYWSRFSFFAKPRIE